ncbi:MAG TPA: hypothetical protein VIK55_14100 [Paludibacter sp.]
MSDTEKKVLLTVTLEVKQMIADLAVTKKAIQDLKAEQKALDQTTEAGAKQYAVYDAEIRKMTATAKEQQKTIDNSIKSDNAKINSMEQMKAKLSLTTAEYNKMSDAERNAAKGQELQAKIKSTSDSLKKLEKDFGDSRRGVGEYERGIGGVTNSMSQLPGAAGSTTKSLLETGKAMWALVANPIGLIIATIAAVFAILYNVLKNFEPVVWAIEKAMAAVGAIFSVLKESVLGLITGQKSLSETTNGLGTSLANAAKEAMRLKQAQLELEEANQRAEVSNARYKTQIDQLIVQSKNRSLSEAERMAMIDKALKIEEKQYKENKVRADQEKKIIEDNIINNYKLTAEEAKQLRLRGVEYAQLLKEKKAITEDDLKNLTAAQVKEWDLLDQSNAIREKAMNRADVLADKEQAKKEKAAEKAVQAAEKAQAALEKKQDREIKSMENIYNLKVKMQQDFDSQMLINDTYYTKRVDMINSNWQDEKKIIDKELQYKKINAEEASLKYIDAEKKKNDSIKSLNQVKINQIVSSLQYELQLKRSHDDEIIAGTKQTTQQQHYTELERIRQDQEEQIKEQNAKLAADPQYQAEHDKQVELIRQKGRTATAQNNTAWEEKERQRKLNTAQTDLSNELEIAQGNINREYELKLKGLEAQKAAELLAAETSGVSVALINEKYAKREQALSLETTKKKFEAIKQYADAGMGVLNGFNELQKQIEAGQLQDAEEKNSGKVKLLDDQLAKGLISQKDHDKQVAKSADELDKKKKQIAHDQAVREKELNIFKTIINTAAAVVAALPDLALSILAGVTGGIELATIIATPVPKAATGGLIVGNSHAQGGTLIEAEGGEMIVNKKATSKFRGILKSINDVGNGKGSEFENQLATITSSLNGPNGEFKPTTPMFINDGGYTARKAINSEGITPEQMKQAMKEAVAEISVNLSFQDFKKEEANYIKMSDRANF